MIYIIISVENVYFSLGNIVLSGTKQEELFPPKYEVLVLVLSIIELFLKWSYDLSVSPFLLIGVELVFKYFVNSFFV